MRFNLSAAAFVALATSVFAQTPTPDFDAVSKPSAQESIPAGSTYNIEWQESGKYAAGTIKISLIGGETQGTQVPLLDIAAGVKNSAKSFSWAVPANLGDKKIYGLVLTLESDAKIFQYSPPFHIKPNTYGGGSDVTTVTTAHGIKTISLSSTSTPVAVTTHAAPVVTTTAIAVHTTTAPCNTTSTFVTKTAPPTIIVKPSSAPNGTAPPPAVVTTPPTGAAGHVAAAPLAFIGGLAVALLAL